MPDTIRTEAELLAQYADNSTGDISAQDLRDLVATLFQNRTLRVHGTQFAPEAGPGKPTPGTIGSASYLSFDVGDVAFFTLALPHDVDSSQDISINLDWAASGTEAAKLVSWQAEYLVKGGAGPTIDTVEGTLTVTDETVPATQWQDRRTTFFIPAAAVDDGDHEIHLKITRVASSNDPVADPVLHHLFAEIPVKWPGAT